MAAGHFLTLLRMRGYFRRPDVTRRSQCHRRHSYNKCLFVVMSKKPFFEICSIACRVYKRHVCCLRVEKRALTEVQVTGLTFWGSMGELRLFLAVHMCPAEVWMVDWLF